MARECTVPTPPPTPHPTPTPTPTPLPPHPRPVPPSTPTHHTHPGSFPADIPEFSRVTVRGMIDTSRTALVGPRPAPKGTPGTGGAGGGGGSGGGTAGYLVFQPLTRPDGSHVVILRGWTSSDTPDRVLAAPVPAPTTVTGVLRRSEAPTDLAAAATAAAVARGAAKFAHVDVPAISAALGVSVHAGDADGTVVEAVDDAAGDGGGAGASTHAAPLGAPAPRPLATVGDVHTTPFTHGVYAATWFTLAVAGVVLTKARFRGGRGGRRGSRR
jgi:cytochrome oxidase assembly protein ShyY1